MSAEEDEIRWERYSLVADLGTAVQFEKEGVDFLVGEELIEAEREILGSSRLEVEPEEVDFFPHFDHSWADMMSAEEDQIRWKSYSLVADLGIAVQFEKEGVDFLVGEELIEAERGILGSSRLEDGNQVHSVVVGAGLGM